MNIADMDYRQGSICQIYDHSWRPTSLQGRYKCRTCGVVAYCPGCLLVVPSGATKMRCERHKKGEQHG